MNSDDHAIVVGINGYEHFDPLSGAENDAVAFAQWLMSTGGVPVPNVNLILSSDVAAGNASPYPVKYIVDRALMKLMPPPGARKGRRLYFYFAGHGCAPGIRDIALLMADTASDTLGLSMAADSYRYSLRARGAFDELVFILDCCRNVFDGAVPGVSPFSGFEIAQRADEVRHLICFGTGIGKEAWQTLSVDPNQSRGLFTKALIDGLNGAAADEHQNVTAVSLEDYVKSAVRTQAALSGFEQIPEFDGSYGGIVFATGVVPKEMPVCIAIPPDWAGTVVLMDGQLNPLGGPGPVTDTMSASLARGIYCLSNPETGRHKLFYVEGPATDGVLHV